MLTENTYGGHAARPMRILVDHSGYALLNIGDIAMLSACVRRLRTLWPAAQIRVLTESPDRLHQHCPDVTTVVPTLAGRFGLSRIPLSRQLAAEQVWKSVMPLMTRSVSPAGSADLPMIAPDTPRGSQHRDVAPMRILAAVRWADAVVSSGGGFISDEFWWHGAGVLSVLAMGQRLGKPTAMFGQAIGPTRQPVMNWLARSVIPKLRLIGLREGVRSAPLLRARGVSEDRIHVTGDDALLLATPAVRPPTGDGIGLNVRVAPYSGVDSVTARHVVAITRDIAARRQAATVALPISRYSADSDLHSVRLAGLTAVDGNPGDGAADIRCPAELGARIAGCRAVVTGSYHAAVFALAAGIPAVCLSNSAYYDSKFEGLAAQFPHGCSVVRPGRNLRADLDDAVTSAWEARDDVRDHIHRAAKVQVSRGDLLYRRFKDLVSEQTDVRQPHHEELP